jgi:tetratricopeptide (TPR) repeat protein
MQSKILKILYRIVLPLLLLTILVARAGDFLAKMNGNLALVISLKISQGCDSKLPLACFCNIGIKTITYGKSPYPRVSPVLLTGGKCIEGIRSLEQWLAMNPGDKLARYWLGSAYYGLQQKDKAGEVWADGLGDWLWEMGKSELKKQNPAEAEWWLSLAAQSEWRAQVDLYDLLSAQGKSQELSVILERQIVTFSPTSEGYWSALGLQNELQENWRTALSTYKQGIMLYPGEEWFYIRAGVVADKLHSWDEALSITQELINFHPNDWWWNDRAAYFAANAGHLKQAETYARTALVSSPYKQVVYALLIDIACASKDYSATDKYFDISVKSEDLSGEYRHYLSYASCLWSQGLGADAINVLRRAEEASPKTWTVLSTLGSYCDKQEDVECAINAYSNLLLSDAPENVKFNARERLRSIGH